MWESLSNPWRACFEEAWAAYCAGSVPIGAVVTDATGRILSRGRNRIYEDVGESGYLYGQILAHAELNALVTLETRGIDRHTSVLYTTTEPCPLCMGAFYMSSVRELRYASREPFGGSVNLLGTTSYLSRRPVKVFGPERADFEIIIMALYVENNLFRRGEGPDAVLDAWEAVVPRGVELGRELYQSGALRKMRETECAAPEVLNRLAKINVV